MKHIKQYNDFVLNEEEGFFKNLLLSTILSLGIVIEPNILERKKLSLDRPVNSSGANTKRNIYQGTAVNPLYDITLSIESNPLDLLHEFTADSEDYSTVITSDELNSVPVADIDV